MEFFRISPKSSSFSNESTGVKFRIALSICSASVDVLLLEKVSNVVKALDKMTGFDVESG
jgi:hypothetical protein